MNSLPLHEGTGVPLRLPRSDHASLPSADPAAIECSALSPEAVPERTVAFRCWHCGRILAVNAETPLPVVSGPCPRCLGWLDIPRSWLQALESTAQPFREIDQWPAPQPIARAAKAPRAPRLKKSGHSRGLFGLEDAYRTGTPEFDTPRTGFIPARFQRWIFPAVLLAFAATGTTVALVMARSKKPPAVARQTSAPAQPATYLPTPASLEMEARQTWRAFTAAHDPAAKAALILNGDRLAGNVARYYGDGGTDYQAEPSEFDAAPLSPDDIGAGVVILTRRAVPDSQGSLVLFFRRIAGADGTPAQMKLDWESYIQEKDNRLHRFSANPGADAEIFRVILRRAHVFDEKPSQRLGLQISDLRGRPIEEPVIVDSTQPLFSRFESQLTWGKPAYATLRLEWQPSATAAGPRLGIGAFICWQLLNVGGTAEQPEALADSTPAKSPPPK